MAEGHRENAWKDYMQVEGMKLFGTTELIKNKRKKKKKGGKRKQKSRSRPTTVHIKKKLGSGTNRKNEGLLASQHHQTGNIHTKITTSVTAAISKIEE